MLPEDMENYLAEISRVLKPGSRCLMSYYLLDEESPACMTAGKGDKSRGVTTTFDFVYSDVCRYAVAECSEQSVAYEEGSVRGLFARYGLQIESCWYGNGSGRRDGVADSEQDGFVAVKE